MRKFMTAIVAAAAMTVTANIAAADEDVLRIGTEGAYPPFNWIDDEGNLKGFDVDIAKALCEEMNRECEFVVQDWDGIIPGLLAKKYDAIVASMSITEERAKKVDFTDKYYQTPARFVAPKGSDIEITEEGLDGKTIGVQRATIHENFVRDNFGDVADVKAYATQDEANLDLIAGRLDAILADSIALQESLLESDAGEDFEFVGPGFTDPKWFGEGVGIAVRPGEDALRKDFNEAIAAIRQGGTYQKINDKYFDFDVYGE